MRTAALLLLWTLVVLYPNPVGLLQSIDRAWSPPIDVAAVAALAATLPDDPQVIEQYVTSTLIPYAVPWETYGVPWYFPTVTEVLAEGQGDCQARAVVLASLLHAKGIPNTFVGSLDHLWVEYPGKHPNALENTAVVVAEQQPDGTYALRWPALADWRTSWDIERAYFLDAMPAWRMWLLAAGWLLVIIRQRIQPAIPCLPWERPSAAAVDAAVDRG